MNKRVSNTKNQQHLSSSLSEQIGRFLAKKQYSKALAVLDKVIEDPMPIFQTEAWVIEERRIAWLYRINLLREWGKLTEALAWACLEVELNPDNVAAVALKKRLKQISGLFKEQPESSAANAKPAVSIFWDGIAGMRELKAMLERDVILPIQEPEIYARYKLSLPNGILLYGPPGCGKTFMARKLAQVSGFDFIEVTPGDLASPYVHGTQGKIAELFAKAKQQAPCMIFFDELDAMVPNRGGQVGHHYSSEVNEFLVHLNECNKHRILVIGATNLPTNIDAAVRRPGRLDKKFFVGPPDYEARVELLKLYMENRPQGTIDWQACASELEGYTCAEIEFIVNEAARKALADKRAILTPDLILATTDNPASLSGADIDRMKSI